MTCSMRWPRPPVHSSIRGGGRSFWLGALCLAACGCSSLPPAERDELTYATQAYNKGDISGAAAKLDRIIRDYPNAAEIAEAYYVRGLCRHKAGSAQAAGDFERAIAKSQRADLTALARASLASVHYGRSDWRRAADLYKQSIPGLPDTPPTDQVLYRAGLAMQRCGQWQDATRQFARILWKFKTSPLVEDASRLATWQHPYFAIQLAAFPRTDSAATAVQDYRARGLEAVQESRPRKDGAMWVVMTGRYGTYTEAQAALGRVRAVQPDAFIIPTP